MNATLLLVIATLALVVGPLLERVGRRWPSVAAWIDGATVGGIVVVAFVHLLPEAGAHLSAWAALWFLLGLMLPTLGERLMHLQAQSWRFSLGALVVVLLIVHEVIESAALASRAESYDANITIATLLVIVGHRLPLGLFIWGQTRARFGLFWSVAALGFLAAASLAGPLLVPERFRHGEFSAVLSALLAGGLLHLVLQHRPHLDARGVGPRRLNAAAALGAVMAVAFFVPYLVGVEIGHDHGDDAAQFPARLWELVAETSLPLLVGVIGAALIEAWLPGSVVGWLARGSRLRQAAAGVLVGAPMPVCSCGVLPIYRSLALRGVSPTAGLAFLIAAPEIGIDSLLLSLPMLGTSTTVARLVCALLVALSVGWIVGRMAEAAPVRADHAHEHGHPQIEPAPRGVAALRRALLETWGHLAPWILFGLLVTALVEPWIASTWSSALPSWLQVVVLALIGMPTYICATAATPFAALLLSKGFSAGAVIAFLLVGPATNVTTFGALAQMHSRRVALSFAATALGSAVLLGWGVDLLAERFSIGVGAGHGGEAHEHGAAQLAASVLLGLLTLWVLVREGPRSFLAQLWPEGSAGRAGAHEHHHGGGEERRA